MKAIGINKTGPIDAPDALVQFEADKPSLLPHDLLVQVKGISMNPVDTKVRLGMAYEAGTTKVLGYDAAGVVVEVGAAVTLFKVGDEVFYAGDLNRQGTNAEFHAVDERIVGKKPTSLDFPEAAGIPLTSITAWEILFDSFRLQEGGGEGQTLLIIGGAGGVGSILIQLAKKLTKLTVVATASRQQTTEWVQKMGADHVINHRESLVDQMAALHLQPQYVASLVGTGGHFKAIVELIKPRGHVAFIDDSKTFDIMPGFFKALTISMELMFARTLYQTEDMNEQHKLLTRVSEMLDAGELVSTVNKNFGPLSLETLKAAHAAQESGKEIGKNVLGGF